MTSDPRTDTLKGGVRPVSLAPPASPVARRTGRLVAMVHELHKAGYQRLRVSPGLSPSGLHWRCSITCASNVQPDGFSPRETSAESGLFAPYSSADPGYFGWAGVEGLSARGLAVRFIAAFPRLAELGAGRDWAYAGWLTEFLGIVEQGEPGRYPIFFADDPIDLDAQPIARPPPPLPS